jgi:3-isopropylmalate/(R)-2-methylmalate dehydratase small subunit
LFREAEEQEGYQLAIDLEAKTVTTPSGEAFSFEVDDFRRHCLLNGLDDIGVTLEDAEVIKSYEASRRETAPWLFAASS